MVFSKAFRDYMATGKMPTESIAEDASDDLADHDAKFHGGHYDGKGSCKYREALAKGDGSDELSKTVRAMAGGQASTGKVPDGITFDKADITQFDGDAIVDAGNRWMIQGGGVDGAIHRAAGPELLEQCKQFKADKDGFRIATGDVKVLDAGKLPCKKVIYTVGPDVRQYGFIPEGTEKDAFGNPNCKVEWESVSDKDKELCRKQLADAYRNSFQAAKDAGCKSLATPSLSTGIFSFPKDEAMKIFAKESGDFVRANPGFTIKMCLGGKDPEAVKQEIGKWKAAF